MQGLVAQCIMRLKKVDTTENLAVLHTKYLPLDHLPYLCEIDQLRVSAPRYKIQAVMAQRHHEDLSGHYQHLQSMRVKHTVLQNSQTMFGMMSMLVHHLPYIMLDLLLSHILSHPAAAIHLSDIVLATASCSRNATPVITAA